MIVQVPNFGDRFWTYQIVDARTDSFCSLGKQYGTKPGFYLLAGPHGEGQVPAAVAAVCRSSTDLAVILPRLFQDDTPQDNAAIQPLLNQIMVYPLTEFDGKQKIKDWSKVPTFPGPPPTGGETKWVNPETFFDELPTVMKEVPPLPGEESLYLMIQSVLDAAAKDPKIKETLKQTAIAAESDLTGPLFQFSNNGRPVGNGWTSPPNGARWGVDYLSCAATARSNIFDNAPEETRYIYTDFDSTGERLNGTHAYTVTFPPGQTPPVNGFWSLTLYNAEHLFSPNALNRYSLGTKSKSMQTSSGGSLTIYVQSGSPGQDKDTNWLSAPAASDFSLYIRACWPKAPVLDGTWIATLRTGLSKVGAPGANQGLQAKDPTIAVLLKPLGYATGQFGKNHLGDRNEYLPTVHGFDEFYGNLYHLNAEEEPEEFNYPTDPKFKDAMGPRGVLHTRATDRDDPTEQGRFGRIGRQRIEDTGPLTRKRMETIDDETSAAAMQFMDKQVRDRTPFFVGMNATRMHLRTHVRAEHRDKRGLTARTEYADGMIEHDAMVGALLKKLDDLGIANDTIVLYTADNGPHMNSWPDAAMTPFRSEKDTNWEGAFRVPAMIRWPGHIKAGEICNDIVSALDWSPTLIAAAGMPDVVDRLLKGYTAGAKTFKVHQDGYNQLPFLTGQQPHSARKEFFYFDDDGDLVAMRYENWKIVFMEQRSAGTLQVWMEPLTALRLPKLYDLHADPYERADVTSNTYFDWLLSHAYILMASSAIVGPYLETYKAFPPSQRPASFTIDQAMEKLKQGFGGR